MLQFWGQKTENSPSRKWDAETTTTAALPVFANHSCIVLLAANAWRFSVTQSIGQPKKSHGQIPRTPRFEKARLGIKLGTKC